MFVDRVVIEMIAGKGGNGVVAWRREKYIPKGGPYGGDGGKGGSVALVVDDQLTSLDNLRNQRHLRAENGRQGGSNRQKGRNGADLIIKIPSGTLVKDAVSGEILFDMVQVGEKQTLCEGGRGGRGNASFTTATNRAPNYSTEGSIGQRRRIELELKLIADIGLVGFPNAGKSTLFSAFAQVPVKIAPYPFTTLHPNIGYIELSNYRRIFIADIPGIIKDAHENRGLGLQFLRHIERTKLLLFLLDVSGIDGRTAVADFRVLREELSSYDPGLLSKPMLIVLNKIDLPESAEQVKEFRKQFADLNDVIFEISALERKGLAALYKRLIAYFI